MKNLTYIFAATLFMVACNNEEISSLQDGKNLEVKFTSNLTDYDSQVVSRVNGTSFEPNDEVAIWASSAGIAPFTGKKVLRAGENGQLSSTETFTYQDDNEVSFSALYPASLCTGTDQSDITLTTQTDDNGYQTLQDLLYATGTGSAGSPTVNLPFYHKGVKIDVAVKEGDGINLTDAEVFVKAKSGGVFSFANSSITPTGAEATDIKIPLAVVPDFTNNVNYGSTIVAPQTLEGECIGIKLQGEATTKYVSYSKIELKEGFRYCFHIDTRKNDVGETEISIASTVREEPWISDEPTDGEVEVDEIPVESNLCLVLSNTTLQDVVYGAQVWYELETPLQPNVEYTYSFMAKADSQYKMEIFLQSTSSGEQGYPGGINISTEWQEQSLSFTLMPTDEANFDDMDKLTFNFGTYVGKIYIDNVKLVKSGESENILTNGDFEEGNVNGWKAWNPALFSISAGGEGCNQ